MDSYKAVVDVLLVLLDFRFIHAIFQRSVGGRIGFDGKLSLRLVLLRLMKLDFMRPGAQLRMKIVVDAYWIVSKLSHRSAKSSGSRASASRHSLTRAKLRLTFMCGFEGGNISGAQ